MTTTAPVMATSVNILPLQEFNPDVEIGLSVAKRWETWLKEFNMYIVATGITDNTRKRALLLYMAGARVREIFENLIDTGGDDAFETAHQKLTTYFEPQKNTRYEVYNFRNYNKMSMKHWTRFICVYERLQLTANLEADWMKKSNNK